MELVIVEHELLDPLVDVALELARGARVAISGLSGTHEHPGCRLCKPRLRSPRPSMWLADLSDLAQRAPTSASSHGGTSRASSIGRGGSPSRATGPFASCFYEAANSILTRTRQNFALKSWALKVAKRCGFKKARVTLARRLAVIMHAMLRDGTLFEA